MDNYNFQIRITGLIIDKNKILLVKQKVTNNRSWSLPGGRLEKGEKISDCLKREIFEETGLKIETGDLLYVCDVEMSKYEIIHLTFLINSFEGNICLPTNEYDKNPITDVKFVDICDLHNYGFSQKFINLVSNAFPGRGHYMGDKVNIGL